MKVRLRDNKRIPLQGDITLIFYDASGQPYHRNVHINRVIGEGNSCICYAVDVDFGEANIHKMILKQFYPDPNSYELSEEVQGSTLYISGFDQREDVRQLADLFEKTYDLQNDLSNQEDLMDVVVRPYEKMFAKTTKYILYEANYGESLEKCNITDIKEGLSMIYEVVKSLAKLHKHGILHMDLKPENILWVANQHVKFFDFDASIRMDQIKLVEYIRGDGKHPELLAPELRNLGNFEQNKYLFLTPQVDLYAVGAILFSYLFGRYPTLEECKTYSFENELYHMLQQQYRGMFTEREQKLIVTIVKRSISASLRKRYLTAEQMKHDLKTLLQQFQTEKLDVEQKRVNYRLLASYVLDQYPLYPYRFHTKEGNVVDVSLVGDSPIREELFKNIFACAQMLDTKLKIRFLSKDAQAYLVLLKQTCPALEGNTSIFVNGENQVCAGQALAELYFYDHDFTHYMEQEIDSNYYLIIGKDLEHNHGLALQLAEWIQDNKENDLSYFIGYGDDRGDGYDLHEPIIDNVRLKVVPFGCDANYSINEKLFGKGIGELAFGIHTFYTKQWKERAAKKEIWKSFIGDSYNVRSSLRSALSIPYKFVSCGMDLDFDMAGEFQRRVLSGTESAEYNLKRLMYLEHRSWCCFMITEGYRKPTEDELRHYFFKGKNDQRDKKNLLHPCLCASSEDSGLMLQRLTKIQWDQVQEKEDEIYDELDQISLKIHRLCQEKSKYINLEGKFAELFAELKKEKVSELCKNEFDYFYLAYQKMIKAEVNCNTLWERARLLLLTKLQSFEREKHIYIKEAVACIASIVNEMRIVVERNLYHDYKSSDVTVLQAIPRLLMKEPIRRIYKLYSSERKDNIASSLLIEPDELVLVCDHEVKEQNELEEFLRGRGMTTKVMVQPLSKIMLRKRAKKSVFDITGAQAEAVYRLASEKRLQEIPVIMYHDQKLKSLSINDEAAYYNIQKHLTAEEAVQLLADSKVQIAEQHHLLGLAGNYQQLWNAYNSMSKSQWELMTAAIGEQLQKNYWLIDDKDMSAKNTCHSRVPGRMMEDTGMIKLLYDLQHADLIQNLQMLDLYEQKEICFETSYSDLKDYMDMMVSMAEKEPYQHKFQLVFHKGHYSIKDNTLILRIHVKDKLIKEALEHLNIENVLHIVTRDSEEYPVKFVNEDTQICLSHKEYIVKAHLYHELWQNSIYDDIGIIEDEKDIHFICCKGLETYVL